MPLTDKEKAAARTGQNVIVNGRVRWKNEGMI